MLVNILYARTNLSRLVDAVESGQETEIVITRNSRPVARLVRCREKETGRRIGIAKGKFVTPDNIDNEAAAIAALFNGDDA